MKKILLFAALLPAILFAQIGPIQPTGELTESAGHHLLRYKDSDRYELIMRSDNPYERQTVRLNIGTGPTEAALSLANMYATIRNTGQTFTLQGYTFRIGERIICVETDGATGDICISKNELQDDMLTLIMDMGADYGELSISQGYAPSGNYLLSFDTYNFTTYVSIGFDISGRMSRKYADFDTISLDDIRILREAIRDNYTSVTHAIIGITVCNVLLGESE